MTANKNTSISSTFWLEVYISGFLDSLTKQGYSKKTIEQYHYSSVHLCRHAETLGIGPEDLDYDLFSKLAATHPEFDKDYLEYRLSLLAQSITVYLTNKGIISPPPEVSPVAAQIDESWERLLQEFECWLIHNRGVSESTVIRYRSVFILFLDYFCSNPVGVDNLASFTLDMVYEFLDVHGGKNYWRLKYVRTILRFLFWSGRMPRDLSSAVPPMASRNRAIMTRHVDPETVEKLLASIRGGNTPMELRDYAALLMMARLGLRSREVVAMRLEDFDWSIGRVLIRGKGGDKSHMPLPVDVGEALVDWLCRGRRGSSRHVFVSVLAPFEPFKSSEAINKIIRRAYDRSGLTPPGGEYRTHALRHGLAMNLLSKGISLSEISDVLRHRNVQTTTVYARHDIKSLRQLAVAWPIEGGIQ